MYYLHTKFAIKQPVGKITESKINIVKENFNEVFPEIVQTNESTLVLKNSSISILITADEIAYSFKGDESNINFEEISNYLSCISQLFDLSNAVPLTIQLQAIENSSEDTHEKSKEPISKSIDVSNLMGVGYRLIIKNDNALGNIHIEPFLSDNKKVYFNIALYNVENINLENLNEVINTLYSYGLEQAKLAAKGLFSI